jgi:hypothetical protein
LAGFFRSDLKIPESFTKVLSIYLMLAIGLKGGVEIRETTVDIFEVMGVLLVGVIFSFILPFISYFFVRKTTHLDRLDAAAVSAHYGSVSAVTFSYAMGYIKNEGIIFEGYLVTLMALMEFPAILSGLILAKRSRKLQNQSKEKLLSGKIIREVFLNGSIVLLVGGLIIGMSGNDKGMTVIKPYLIDPFYGILGLFLLELGLVAARRLKEIDGFPKALALFGVYMPLVAATISLTTSYLLGFDLGTTILLTTLAASASYIAVPAAMKIALPDANPAYYVTLSLCITFPFNLIIGVPLYTELAKFIN